MRRQALSALFFIFLSSSTAVADTNDGAGGNGDGVDCRIEACGGGGSFDFDGIRLELDLGKTWGKKFFLGGRLHAWVNGDEAWRLAALMAGAHVELMDGFLVLRPYGGVADIWTLEGHVPMLLLGLRNDIDFWNGGITGRLEGSHYIGRDSAYVYVGRYEMNLRLPRFETDEKDKRGEPVFWDVRIGPHVEMRDGNFFVGPQISWVRTDLPFRIEAAYDFGLQEAVRGHSLRFTLAVDAF